MTTEQTYIAAACLADIPFTLPSGQLPLATSHRPDDICGVALRVGYTGTSSHARPLYRLSLKASIASFKTTVIPGLFMPEQGIFVPS